MRGRGRGPLLSTGLRGGHAAGAACGDRGAMHGWFDLISRAYAWGCGCMFRILRMEAWILDNMHPQAVHAFFP